MKTLSDEHKQHIGEATKRMWERGVFNSPKIRKIWRKTALNGIAKKGKPSPHKFIPSKEMLEDYSKMGDVDLSAKYGVSRKLIIKIRKEYKLPRFNNQHGTYSHEFRDDGKEYKWCGSGHWELVENFGVHSSRYDGLRGHCKLHSNESANKSHNKINNTPEGKSKIRMQNNRRKSGFVLWEPCDEQRAFELYESRCGYCGRWVSYRSVEFDHIQPISKGGKTVPHNMIPSCVECNRGVKGKKNKELVEWLRYKFVDEDVVNRIYENVVSKQSIIKKETRKRVTRALHEMGVTWAWLE